MNKADSTMPILREVLAGAIADRGWNVREAARAVGISRAWMYELLRGSEDASYEVTRKLAAAFPNEAAELYEAAGFPVPPDVAPHLTEDDFEDLMEDTDDLARIFAEILGVSIEEVKRAARELLARRGTKKQR